MALSIEWRPRDREERLKKLVAEYGDKVFESVEIHSNGVTDLSVVTSVFLRDEISHRVYTLALVYKKGPLTAEEKQTIINLARIRYGS